MVVIAAAGVTTYVVSSDRSGPTVKFLRWDRSRYSAVKELVPIFRLENPTDTTFSYLGSDSDYVEVGRRVLLGGVWKTECGRPCNMGLTVCEITPKTNIEFESWIDSATGGTIGIELVAGK